MSGLSNRVMNMKFMQKADALVESKKTEEHEKKIKDMSEWVLPNSSDLLKKKKHNVVQSIGYASINSFGGSFVNSDDEDDNSLTYMVPARRSWGNIKTRTENDDDDPKLDITNLKSAPKNLNNSKKGSDAKSIDEDLDVVSKTKVFKSKKRNNITVDSASNKKKKKTN